MTRRLSAVELLGFPVRLRGIHVGSPIDVLFDLQGMRAVGVDVLCGDDVRRFVPLPAATIATDEITVSSAFGLLEQGDTPFYRERGVSFRSLRGSRVEQDGRELGRLVDVIVDEEGAVTDVVVAGEPTRRVAVGPSLRIHRGTRQAA